MSKASWTPFFLLNMFNAILGSKLKMSQTFVDGKRLPVTFVMAGPCIVTHIKNMDKDGYWAVQLGFGEKKTKNTSKQLQGHFKKLKTEETSEFLPKFLREIKLTEEPQYKIGDVLKVSDIFTPGDIVSVTGVSKGKGFAGGVKRWHFSGGPKTHGQSDRHRAPGSIGQGTTPGRVYRGKKMAGRMGSDLVYVKNLQVISVDSEKNVIEIKGPVPGIANRVLVIRRLNERKEENA